MIKIYSRRVRDLEKDINGIVLCAYDKEKKANICLDLEAALNPRILMQALLNLIMILYDLDYIPRVEELRRINHD